MMDPEKRIVVEYAHEAKRSRAAVVSFLLMVSVLFIDSMKWSVILLALAVMVGIVAIVRIKTSDGRLKGKTLAKVSIVLSVFLFLLFGLYYVWHFDAEPIPDDYTIADLRSAAPEYSQSYELLLSLANEKDADPNSTQAIGLSVQDVKFLDDVKDDVKEGYEYKSFSEVAAIINENDENITRLWEKAKKGRETIDKLNEYDEIADLSEISINFEYKFARNLKRLTFLYNIYVLRQIGKENFNEAVNELIKIDSVSRKLVINHRSMIMKLVCIGNMARSFRTVNYIANNSQISSESLMLIAEHFKPFTEEQVSMRNSFIAEYLMMKKSVDQNFSLQTWQNKPALKRNSMLRLYKNDCDYWVSVEPGEYPKAPLSVWPKIYPDWLPEISIVDGSEETFPWYYRCYNPVGAMLASILKSPYHKIVEINTRLKIKDDLLQVVLNKRLGEEYSLKARAYSDEYIIDVEKRIIFSPGPDGEIFTDDDIKMEINPEVLGF